MKRPIRILHIVGGMNTGGVETWLMHVLRHIDRDRYQFDFLTHTLIPCFYDKEILLLGGRIFPCHSTKSLLRYALRLLCLLNTNGPYDVVHSHVDHFSGFVVLFARFAGVPVRIAHSHNDITFIDRSATLLRKFYLWGTERLIRHHATNGLACSRRAAHYLFGEDWESDGSRKVLPCGIDFIPFSNPCSRSDILQELAIPEDSVVVGHVGRFVEQKNHVFIIDVFNELVLINPRIRLLLIGDGSLRKMVEEKVEKLNLIGKVIFTGARADIPRIMLGAMDVFLFPSLFEGLGLVLIEAQAAGLRCVISDVIPPEAFIVPSLIEVVSLKNNPKEWARVVANQLKNSTKSLEPLAVVRDSSFNVMSSIRGLEGVYSHDNKG